MRRGQRRLTRQTRQRKTRQRKRIKAPPLPPPSYANAADAKKIFGTMRRPNPTVKKGVKNAAYFVSISWGADQEMTRTTMKRNIPRMPSTKRQRRMRGATHGVEFVDRSAFHRNIMALVQLRPRDAAWEECRRKLSGLVEGDGGGLF